MRTLLIGALLWPALAWAAPPPADSEDSRIMAPYVRWITTQHDSAGHWCCDIGDGRPVEAEIRLVGRDGTPFDNIGQSSGESIMPTAAMWFVHVTPEHFPGQPDHWLAVPDDKIIRNANPTGLPILWLLQGRVQCFAPPDGV
jgi:hypothetical protein